MSFLEGYIAIRNNVDFSADSVLKIITEIDIFIKFPKNEIFSHSSINCLVQCCPEKAILMQKFWSWYLMEKISE